MDPDVTLSAARELYEADEIDAAAEQYAALDEWMSKGGHLPKAWAVVV